MTTESTPVPSPAPAPPGAPVEITGAEAVVRSLEMLGITDVFGLPGGAILRVYDPLLDSRKLRHILVRHEQGAGHAAEGYASSSGKLGVAIATSGPGATNLVTAIADALQSHNRAGQETHALATVIEGLTDKLERLQFPRTDQTAINQLEDRIVKLVEKLQGRGVRVGIVHLHGPALDLARRAGLLDRLGAGHVLANLAAGVAWAQEEDRSPGSPGDGDGTV